MCSHCLEVLTANPKAVLAVAFSAGASFACSWFSTVSWAQLGLNTIAAAASVALAFDTLVFGLFVLSVLVLLAVAVVVVAILFGIWGDLRANAATLCKKCSADAIKVACVLAAWAAASAHSGSHSGFWIVVVVLSGVFQGC
jgi:hypothetical protein